MPKKRISASQSRSHIPKRKPSGYWNDFANVERELLGFISEYELEGVMPTASNLIDADRKDLVSALRKHGGFPSVAKRLGLERPNSAKTPGFWNDFENVEKEIRSIAIAQDMIGVMPSVAQLTALGRSDLVSAIGKHGGFRTVAERLHLERKDRDKPFGYYNDFENVERELRAFITKYGIEGVMPTRNELASNGHSSLNGAIHKQGGFATVAKRLGLKQSNKDKPSGYWLNIENVERELRGFITEHGVEGIMPYGSELLAAGRGDLKDTIGKKHGGFRAVAKRFGLKYQDTRKHSGYWNDFSSVEKELREFIKDHGTNDVMPTDGDLISINRFDLLSAIRKFGTMFEVAARLGLKTKYHPPNYWDDFSNVERELRAFINEFGTDGFIPTEDELTKARRSDLVRAIHMHGGIRQVAGRLNLSRPNVYAPIGYWDDFLNVEKELRAFIVRYGTEGVMPTDRELAKFGYSGLKNAFHKHGGLGQVAQRLNLSRPNAYVPIGYWDEFANLEKELRTFIAEYGKAGVMPTLRELNVLGRRNISYALAQYGGSSVVARRLGLTYSGPEHVTPHTASSIEQTARAIQPLAESNLLSGAQVMIILRRAGLLEFRNKRVLKLNASLARGNHNEIESAIANLPSDSEEIAIESVEIAESDALTSTEAEALLSGGLEEKDRLTSPISTSIAPDVEGEQAVIRGLSALGELRLPLDEVLSLLTSKILWQEFYKRLYAWYGSLDAAQTVTTQDVEAAILSAYPEHTSNEFVSEASAIFTVEVEQAVNFAASLNDYGWRGPRLRLHQADAARRMAEVLSRGVSRSALTAPTFILDADDPGMGKSASFLAAVAISGVRSIILIAPKTVADDTWTSTNGEIHRCLPDSRIVRGIDKAIMHKDSPRLTFFVLHYEELLNDEAMATLAERSFDCLCLDEIHFIKQRAGKEESNRRKAINGLRACSRVAIGLAGTPLVNELSEPMSLLQTLSQNAPQFDHSRLSNRRLSDIADVFEALLPHIIRRRKINVLLHLPHCDVREVQIPMLGLEDEMLELHRLPKSQASHALVELRKVAIEAKLPYLQSRAQSARKLLILTYLTDDVSQRIYEYLQDFIPDQVAHINGATPRDDRKKILNAFRSSENVRVLVGTIGTIGTGLTLFDPLRPDTANEIIVADLPYTWAEFEQGIARLYREGQKHRVMVEVLLTQIATTLSDGSPYITIDEGIWTLIKSKSELSDVAIDGKYDTTDAASKVQKALRRWLKQTREVGVEPLAVERRPAEQTEAQRWRSEIGRLRGMSAAKADEMFADPQYTQEFLDHLQTSTAAKLSHDWLKGRLNLLMRSDLVIIDMGCGLNPFADLPCRVIGLDRHDREGQLRGKMENPPLEDKSADVIIYSLSLYGTAIDLFAYFTHAARILRGGGHLFLVEPESAFTQDGLIRFVNGLRQFGFELVGSVKDLRGEDGTLLKGMRLTLTGEVGKPEEKLFEKK